MQIIHKYYPKKYDLQIKQLKDTQKREKYKVYGEMINTYGYDLPDGAKVLNCTNYYTGKEMAVPLDPTLSPRENSLKYFERYGKLKPARRWSIWIPSPLL